MIGYVERKGSALIHKDIESLYKTLLAEAIVVVIREDLVEEKHSKGKTKTCQFLNTINEINDYLDLS